MRQVAPHWRVGPIIVSGRSYYAEMGCGSDPQPRVNGVFTETSRGATRYLNYDSRLFRRVAAGVQSTRGGESK